MANYNEGFGTMKIPRGFRFYPNDEELITILKWKIAGRHCQEFPIPEVDIYACSPMELSEMYKLDREDEWHFFTPRSKKFSKGDRPDRTAKDGYWKATAAAGPIRHPNTRIIIGHVRTLNFRERSKENETYQKTDWLMREYTLNHDANVQTRNVKEFDGMVLVKMYKKRGSSSTQFHNDNQAHEPLLLQNQSFNWTQRPNLAAKPVHHSLPLEYLNHIGLLSNPNYRLNPAFFAQYQGQVTTPLQIPPLQIVEKMEDQNLSWTSRPSLVAEPLNQWPSLKYSADMGFNNHSNYGFNGGFCAQEDQPFGLNEVEAIGPQLDELLNLEQQRISEPNGNQVVEDPNFINQTHMVSNSSDTTNQDDVLRRLDGDIDDILSWDLPHILSLQKSPAAPVVDFDYGCQAPSASSCFGSEDRIRVKNYCGETGDESTTHSA